MKEHIIRAILYQDMSVKWKDAELNGEVNVHLNVHQKARQFVEVELGDFLLSEGEAILASFEKQEDGQVYHINPEKMENIVGNSKAFRIQLPTLVHNTPGIWGTQFYLVTGYEVATGEYVSAYPFDKLYFSEHSSFLDDGLTVPTKENLSALYREIENKVEQETQNTANIAKNSEDIADLQELVDINSEYTDNMLELIKSDIRANSSHISSNWVHIKKNTEDISKNANKIALLTDAQLQSGLQIIQPIEDAYSERVTANGESILDWQGNGSTARLLKVVGDTQATKNIFNFEKVEFADNKHDGTMVFEKTDNSLVFKSVNGGNNYFHTGSSATGDLSAFLLKPNTTYTSLVTINVSLVNDTDYELDGAGSYSCCLLLQDSGIFTSNRIYIVDSCRQNKPYDKVGTYTVLTVFTTPEDLSAYPYVATRVGNNIQVTYTNLMIVEGEYTEETMPKYVQGFDGLKSASFQGIISSGLEESVLSFPATVDCGLGVTIDFEKQKILNYGVEITLTGNEETIGFSDYGGRYGVFFFEILPTKEKFAQSVSTDGNPNKAGEQRLDINSFWIGTGSSGYTVTWLGILDILGFTKNWVDRDNYTQEDKLQAIGDLRAYLSQRYANGNPVKIRYVSSTLQSETPFTDEQKAVGNEYKAWTDGTEQVTGNASALYATYPTLTQEYVLVMDIKETTQETVDETITQALQEAY